MGSCSVCIKPCDATGPTPSSAYACRTEEHPAGTIEVLANDSMVGYLDRMAHAEAAKGFSPDVWFMILRQARSIVAKARKRMVAEAR